MSPRGPFWSGSDWGRFPGPAQRTPAHQMTTRHSIAHRLEALLLISAFMATVVLSAATGQPPKACASREPRLTLAFVGDILLNGTVGDLIKVEGVMAPWAGVKDVLSSADFSIGNLECAVGTTGEPALGKAWTFRAYPAALHGLREAGIDVVSLANNHTLDYGTECMLETVNVVRQTGVHTAGAGANLSDARKPVILEKNGLKVGVLATNMIYPDISWSAGDDSPGQAIDSAGWYPAILGAIKDLAAQVDVVAVYVHWSAERQEVPEKWVLPVARAMREAGAHLIIGSHPHIMNGFDYDGRNLTAYSMGNFVFSTRPEMPRLQIGSVLEVTVAKGLVESASVIPTRIVWGKTVIEDGEAKLDTLRWLSSLSDAWNTDVDAEGNILPILFSDMDGHWARNTVTRLVVSGAIEGYPDRTFRPEGPISKGEYAALFGRAIGTPDEIASAPPVEGFSLCDEDSWAHTYLEYLAGKGLVSGSDSKWAPSNSCSRLDALEVMRKHTALSAAQESPPSSASDPANPVEPSSSPEPVTPSAPPVPAPASHPLTTSAPATAPAPPAIPANLQTYTDLAGLDQASLDTASWAVEIGLMKGYEDSTLRLNETVKRAEMTELLWRYLGL